MTLGLYYQKNYCQVLYINLGREVEECFQPNPTKKLGRKEDSKSRKGRKLKQRKYLNYLIGIVEKAGYDYIEVPVNSVKPEEEEKEFHRIYTFAEI